MEHQNLDSPTRPFRTEGMLRYPFFAPSDPDYNEAREVARKRMNAIAGTEIGDPAKGMELLVDVVRGEGKFEGREWPLGWLWVRMRIGI